MSSADGAGSGAAGSDESGSGGVDEAGDVPLHGYGGANDPYLDPAAHRMHGVGIAVQADAPMCLRCDGPGILEARVPHVWDNGFGEPLPCVRVLVLCPACDHADPDAADLLALFRVDDRVDGGNAAVFAELAGDWVTAVAARPADPATLVEAD
ncbi:DUF6300 family protein [Yinghuangia sp. YIM S09857]|uniref:DUF6300 family protein n=1 Tax=Yinghuangia sp. YIM S09857 TaxID=3436929 RepID=UPI003F5331AE